MLVRLILSLTLLFPFYAYSEQETFYLFRLLIREEAIPSPSEYDSWEDDEDEGGVEEPTISENSPQAPLTSTSIPDLSLVSLETALRTDLFLKLQNTASPVLLWPDGLMDYLDQTKGFQEMEIPTRIPRLKIKGNQAQFQLGPDLLDLWQVGVAFYRHNSELKSTLKKIKQLDFVSEAGILAENREFASKYQVWGESKIWAKLLVIELRWEHLMKDPRVRTSLKRLNSVFLGMESNDSTDADTVTDILSYYGTVVEVRREAREVFLLVKPDRHRTQSPIDVLTELEGELFRVTKEVELVDPRELSFCDSWLHQT